MCRELCGLGEESGKALGIGQSSAAVHVAAAAAILLCCHKTHSSRPKSLSKNTCDSKGVKMIYCNAAGRWLSCDTTNNNSRSENVSVFSEYSYLESGGVFGFGTISCLL